MYKKIFLLFIMMLCLQFSTRSAFSRQNVYREIRQEVIEEVREEVKEEVAEELREEIREEIYDEIVLDMEVAAAKRRMRANYQIDREGNRLSYLERQDNQYKRHNLEMREQLHREEIRERYAWGTLRVQRILDRHRARTSARDAVRSRQTTSPSRTTRRGIINPSTRSHPTRRRAPRTVGGMVEWHN